MRGRVRSEPLDLADRTRVFGRRRGAVESARHVLAEREAAAAQAVRSLTRGACVDSCRGRRGNAGGPLKYSGAGILVAHRAGLAREFPAALSVAAHAVPLGVLETEMVAALGHSGLAGALEEADRLRGVALDPLAVPQHAPQVDTGTELLEPAALLEVCRRL